MDIAIKPLSSEYLPADLLGSPSVEDPALTIGAFSNDFDQWYYSNRDYILDTWSKAISGQDQNHSTVDWSAALPELWNRTIQSLYGAESPWSAASDLETIATEPVVAIDTSIWPTYYMISTLSLAPESLNFCVAELSEVMTFPPSCELEFIDFEGQDTSYIASLNSGVDPTLDEGISLLLVGNPNTVGDYGVILSPQHLEEAPTQIWPSGEILSIDSGDLVKPFAPIDTTWVTDPLESFDNIAVEGTESAMENDPPILANHYVMSVTNIYNSSIDWEIKPLPFSGDFEVVDVEASETFADPIFDQGDSPYLAGEYVYTPGDNVASLPLLPACLDYPTPEGEPQDGGETTDGDSQPRTGILFRGEGNAGLQQAGAQPAVDPITGSPARAQPTEALQPSSEAKLNLAVDPVLKATPAPAGFGSPRGNGFSFAPPYPDLLTAASLQESTKTVPTTSGLAAADGSSPATSSALNSALIGFGSSARDPLLIGWGIESLIPPLIADPIPDLMII